MAAHHRQGWEPSGAQRSSRWLNPRSGVRLFASTRFRGPTSVHPSLVRLHAFAWSFETHIWSFSCEQHLSMPRMRTSLASSAGEAFTQLRRAKSDTHCRLLGTAHRFHLRRDSLCSSGTRSRERSSRITSPSQPDRTLPASGKGDEGHDQSACCRLSPALGNSSRGLALRDHRLGSRSNLTHLFAFSPPIVASTIDSVSFRLGHAVFVPTLSSENALMITMRRIDNCFPTPSTTSTRAS